MKIFIVAISWVWHRYAKEMKKDIIYFRKKIKSKKYRRIGLAFSKRKFNGRLRMFHILNMLCYSLYNYM